MQNSSSTFQRLMDNVLRTCHEYARVYIDDICIFSKMCDDHLFHIKCVLSKLQDAGLTVKPKKCSLFKSQVSYLGHTVGGGQNSPNLDKVEAVREFPTPITKRDVRAFWVSLDTTVNLCQIMPLLQIRCMIS